MSSESDQQVIQMIAETPDLMTILQMIERLHLRQGALAAGSIRNTVWQILNHQPTGLTSDVDVVFFDPRRPKSDDGRLDQQLNHEAPQFQWQVKNEAHMHHYDFTDRPPFTSVRDAIANFVETPTCIGAYLKNNQIQLIAPYGTDDLVNLICRPVPSFRNDNAHLTIYQDRIRRKGWQREWPALKIMAL
ncbi:MAG: nucleotidyltransferase family protein [Lentilactobacillus diolivorans]|uniref:nucleotidyltransferase family protein n=1 Tax=Lentilactobacillus diolivorans TaxID=179838 RepID=UPI0039E80713